jgi:hypothetical protein
MNEGRVYCVSDYVDNGRVVWRETGVNLDSHALAVGCHGRRKERPLQKQRSMSTQDILLLLVLLAAWLTPILVAAWVIFASPSPVD